MTRVKITNRGQQVSDLDNRPWQPTLDNDAHAAPVPPENTADSGTPLNIMYYLYYSS